MSGFGQVTTPIANIVVSYTAPSTVIPSTAEWVVVGQFHVSRNVEGRLDCEGVLSDSGLTMEVRFWDVAAEAVATGPGVASTTSQTPVRFRGSSGAIAGGKDYQIQARVTGSSLDEDFGVLLTATMS